MIGRVAVAAGVGGPVVAVAGVVGWAGLLGVVGVCWGWVVRGSVVAGPLVVWLGSLFCGGVVVA